MWKRRREDIYSGIPLVDNHADVSLDELPTEVHQFPNWQPYSFRGYFFATPLLVHFLQLVFTSLLLHAWYTESAVLRFDIQNTAPYYLWQYVPLTTVVCSGFFWEIIYLDVCQLEPFYQLTHPEGVTLKDSLSLDYMTSFTWFVPFRAFRHQPHRHNAVGLGSLTYILVGMVLPTTTAGMLKIQWIPPTSVTSVAVLPFLAVLNLLVLLASIICGVLLYILLQHRRTGVYSAPASISSIAALMGGSNILEAFCGLRSCDTQARIDEALGQRRFRLEHKPGHDNPYQICLLDPVDGLSMAQERPTKLKRAEAHSWWLWGRIYVALSLLLLALQILLGVIAIGKSSATQITVRKMLSTILNVSAATLWSNWHTNIALLEPYYRLREGRTTSYSASDVPDPYCRIEPRRHRTLDGSFDALHLAYTSSAISNLFITMRKTTRARFVSFIGFCVVLLQSSVITNPAFVNVVSLVVMLLASTSDRSILSVINADWSVVPRGMIVDLLGTFIFILMQAVALFVGLVLVLIYKRTPIMPRKPYTYSSTILYLCHSRGLLDDLAGTSVMSKRVRNDHLRQKDRKYGLGWIMEGDDGYSHVAIERIEDIKAGFVFGEELPERAR